MRSSALISRDSLVVILSLVLIHTVFAQVPLSTKSQKAIELYQQADNYRVRGQNQEAIRLLNQALDKDKNFAEAYYRLGLVYMTLKNYPVAISNFFETKTKLHSIMHKKKTGKRAALFPVGI